MHATLLEVEDRGKGRLVLRTQNTVDIEGEEKPALTMESLAFVA
jgi:acyl dehydratase